MASLLRVVGRQGCRILTSQTRQTCLSQRLVQPTCWISTSKKNKDAAITTQTIETETKSTESLADRDENWMSYGYSLVDKDEDRWSANAVLFVGLTLCIIWGGFFIAYFPDHRMRDWAQREGYLELARRESAGLPLIDANLVDPASIDLPSDEELGDTDIII